ncbi:MAG: hypothetical protein AAGD25_34860 [Cyanobacteria bacterium P01_F01_bin.150]
MDTASCNQTMPAIAVKIGTVSSTVAVNLFRAAYQRRSPNPDANPLKAIAPKS